MSTKDFIKKSVLNAFTQYDAPKLAVALLAALALGILIYLVYRKFYTGVVYSRSFAVTLVGMCVLTCMVTLAISTNVVISLGMVGALSIVRFRTAVKDPLDLLYMFWAITTGITAGANMFALVLIAAIVMILVSTSSPAVPPKAGCTSSSSTIPARWPETTSCARWAARASSSSPRRCEAKTPRWP